VREEAMSTLERVILKRKALRDYRSIIGDKAIEEIQAVAEELKGVKLLHLNSTAFGGGVAELLNSLVPLEADCGLNVEWRVLAKNDGFFGVTKKIHNALQGQADGLSPEQQEIYLQSNERYAASLGEDYDVVIVHDPQPAAIPSFHADHRAKWAWRCHIDTSQPDPNVWGFLQPFIQGYDAAVFTLPEFTPPGLSGPDLVFIPPAIDPATPKNRALPKYLCREVVAEFGVDLARPLLLQVSRFDPWKDPLGVIATYHLVKEELPEVQLALVGSMAEDDPEGWEIYDVIRKEDEKDPDLYTFTNLTGVHAHEVNAFQRVADVVIQKSIREGFGLVVSEALWKGTPVVAGNTGGIRLQMEDGVGGFLVDSIQEAAERILFLLAYPASAESIARRGWERVRDRYLMPRLLLDELKLVRSLIRSGRASSGFSVDHAPVARQDTKA
jgi:trehalose synthase